MKFPESSISALMGLGYTDRESQFLYVVATHSGHFLRKHFVQFSGMERGRADDDFIVRALDQQHIHAYRFQRNCFRRYHLFSRQLYSVLGKENSSNRKPGSEAKSNLKLRILEFVIDNPHENYLEEEADKVRFFTQQRQIPLSDLPAKIYRGIYRGQTAQQTTTRYFVDKFPLFLLEQPSGANPLPVFTYFEEDLESPLRFRMHLEWYRPLFQRLGSRLKLIYVSYQDKNFESAERNFESVLSGSFGTTPAPALLKYFELRRRQEQPQPGEKFTGLDHIKLVQAQKKFSHPDYERLFRHWLGGGGLTNSAATPSAAHHGQFETHLVSL